MRIISGLFLILLMGVVLWLYYGRKSTSSLAQQPSLTVPTQKEAGELQLAHAQPVKPPTEAAQNLSVSARKPVPALDTASPLYRSALVLMEQRFIRMLERETQAHPWPPEQLVDLANRFAALQLELTMHEAGIADYTLDENKAVISIPTYPHEGEAFQTQMLALLPPDFGSDGFKRDLVMRFGYFGRYAQQLEVSPVTRTIEDQPVKHFQIVHRFLGMEIGSSVGVSQLTDIYLGPYAPFIGAFPKE